ncbi:MAG: PDC sensor domain-containing protein [Gammaproteobacteria bacterium]
MSRFKNIITEKKRALEKLATTPLMDLAEQCATVWHDADKLDALLLHGIHQLTNCSLIFAVDTKGILISSNVESDHLDTQWRGTDLTGRPFLQNRLPYQGLTISQVYTSRHTMQPTLSVMQAVRHAEEILGFIAADFNVDALPAADAVISQPGAWKQFKGDPAIRGTLFMQERAISAMDKVLDEVMEIITDLMQHHGIFHTKIHFSSSRASFWSVDDPFDYTIHLVDEITNPDRCLAYPRRKLHQRVQVSEPDIAQVLSLFKALRHADETIYLRSASFNVINGMVGLTFSCDGSHFLHYQEFIDKDTDFWFGAMQSPSTSTAAL